jgi:basic type II keratin
MESANSTYSSGYSSGFGGGFGGGYGSGYGGGYSGSNYSSGSGYGGGSTSNVTTQNKKSVVIKMIETKDGKVVSESSEVVDD